MNDTLRIRPVEGRSLPRENAPKSRITAPTTVPSTAYYRRALYRGDVELADTPGAIPLAVAERDGVEGLESVVAADGTPAAASKTTRRAKND